MKPKRETLWRRLVKWAGRCRKCGSGLHVTADHDHLSKHSGLQDIDPSDRFAGHVGPNPSVQTKPQGTRKEVVHIFVANAELKGTEGNGGRGCGFTVLVDHVYKSQPVRVYLYDSEGNEVGGGKPDVNPCRNGHSPENRMPDQTPAPLPKPIPIYDSIEPERFCYVCPQCGCEIDARKVVNRFYFKGHVKEANVG